MLWLRRQYSSRHVSIVWKRFAVLDNNDTFVSIDISHLCKTFPSQVVIMCSQDRIINAREITLTTWNSDIQWVTTGGGAKSRTSLAIIDTGVTAWTWKKSMPDRLWWHTLPVCMNEVKELDLTLLRNCLEVELTVMQAYYPSRYWCAGTVLARQLFLWRFGRSTGVQSS